MMLDCVSTRWREEADRLAFGGSPGEGRDAAYHRVRKIAKVKGRSEREKGKYELSRQARGCMAARPELLAYSLKFVRRAGEGSW